MSYLDVKNIVECQTCGNRDSKLIAEREGGYVCKCCGVWYKKKPTDEEFREQIRCEQGFAQLRAYRFGDARDTFQIILQNNPDNINALWGLLLSRFGVVYIKGFYKGVVEPIYCFPNYERMKRRYVQSEPEFSKIMDLLKNDAELRFDYEKKAEKIDDALDNFKEYKQSTERDVFICVKISAATEQHPERTGRTKDYEFALKVYNELKSRGVNAFYSYVTLENDVKSDEKIWRNLVKSKKMLLIGSSEEYLESPWVKSEWKRWLHLKREEDLYVCALPSAGESPFDILPEEIAELEQQIYTRNDVQKLIAHICNGILPEALREEEAGAEAEHERLRQAAEVEHERLRQEAEEAKKKGKIVYKDGHEEILKYGITEIREKAYYKNENIVSVVLPNSVTSIGDSAFWGCRSLTSITVPDSVTCIESSAFADCSSLVSITIPDSVTTIGNYAFWSCRSLASITIPRSVTEIGRSAFYKCNSLTSINIPDSVTSIGNYAFNSCDNLKDIYYGGSISDWKKIKIDKNGNEKLNGNLFQRAKIHYNCK